MSSLSISRIDYELTWCFASILWIQYVFSELTFKSQIYYEFTIFRKFTIIHFRFANLLWKYFVFREYTKNSLSISQIHHEYSLLREFTMNLLFLRIHFESNFGFANSLSFWRINYEFTWSFAIHNECTIFIAILLWIYLMIRKYFINSLFILRIHYYSLSNREFTLN